MKNPHPVLQYMKSIYWGLNKSPTHKLIKSLHGQLANKERHTPAVVSFLGYTVNIVDSASFFSQFKEIFVDEIYKFSPASNIPVIYDIGANIGIGTLYLKQCFPLSRIVALEADPAIAAVLASNIEQNNLSNVTVFAKAAWINDKGVSFSSDGADGGSILASENCMTVPSVRLKTLLESERDGIALLKMDIEGAEATVVPDLVDVLPNVQHIFVEYHSWNNESQNLDELLKIFTEAGFRYYIQTIGNRRTPFMNKDQHLPMDLQLNIFGWRI